MTEKERVKQTIIEILRTIPSGWADTDHGDDCKMIPCPECVADAILAIPGLFVEDQESRLEVEIPDNDGYDDTWDVTTQARAQGWKKAGK